MLGLRQQHWQIGQSMPPEHASLKYQKYPKIFPKHVTLESSESWHLVPPTLTSPKTFCLLCLAPNPAHSSNPPCPPLIWIPYDTMFDHVCTCAPAKTLIRISTCDSPEPLQITHGGVSLQRSCMFSNKLLSFMLNLGCKNKVRSFTHVSQ